MRAAGDAGANPISQPLAQMALPSCSHMALASVFAFSVDFRRKGVFGGKPAEKLQEQIPWTPVGAAAVCAPS